MRPPAPPPKPGARPSRAASADLQELKWTEADFAEAKDRPAADGQGRPTSGRIGDLEAGFKNAALVLDETFVTPNTSHQCLETRTAMAYWQNGKVFMFTPARRARRRPCRPWRAG